MAGQDINVVLSINDSKYSAAIERARTGIKRLQSDMESSGHATVSTMQASSAAIRLMEGNIQNNVRAVERLASMVPGLGAALQAVFPFVAGAAFVGILYRMGEGIQKSIEHARDLATNLSNGFRQLEASGKLANDELSLTNAKLAEQISKIEGKPVNNLAVTLAEARVEADKLANSLLKDQDEFVKLVAANHVGIFDQLLGKGSDKNIVNTSKGFEASLTNAGFQHAHDVAQFGPDSAQAKASQAAITGLLDQIERYTTSEIVKRSGRGEYAMQNGREVFRSDPNGPVSYAATFGNQDSNIAILQGLQNISHQQQDSIGLNAQHAQLQSRLDVDRSAPKVDNTDADDHERYLTKATENYRKSEEEDAQHIAEMNKLGEELLKNQTESDNKLLAERQRAANELEKFNDELADIARKGANAQALQGIEFARSAGQITAYSAALAIANVHTQEYIQTLAQLQSQKAGADAVGNTSDSQAITKQIVELQSNRPVQEQADQHNIDVTTVNYQLSEFANSLTDTAGQIRSIISSTLGNLNNAILSGKGFADVGKNFLRSAGNAGLQQVEGRTMDALGIQHGKPGTNASNPMYVREVDPHGQPVKGVASSGGGGSSDPISILDGTGRGGTTSIVGGIDNFVRGIFGGHHSLPSTASGGSTFDVTGGQGFTSDNLGIPGFGFSGPSTPPVDLSAGDAATLGGNAVQASSNGSVQMNRTSGLAQIFGSISNGIGQARGFLDGMKGGSGGGSTSTIGSLGAAVGSIFGHHGGGGAGQAALNEGMAPTGLDTDNDYDFSGMGFADGGMPPVGQASIVGEEGPELFVPKRAGTVVPNGKFGGGDTHIHDFRGANFSHTDPNMVQKQIMAAAPQIAGAAVKSIAEKQARSPSSRR